MIHIILTMHDAHQLNYRLLALNIKSTRKIYKRTLSSILI